MFLKIAKLAGLNIIIIVIDGVLWAGYNIMAGVIIAELILYFGGS